MKPRRIAVGDTVQPKPEWVGSASCVPSGKVVKVEKFGEDGAVYVEGEPRAFAGYVFDVVPT